MSTHRLQEADRISFAIPDFRCAERSILPAARVEQAWRFVPSIGGGLEHKNRVVTRVPNVIRQVAYRWP